MATPRLPPRTLATGTELPSTQGRRGLGVLTIRNGTAHDAVVKLVESGTTQQTRRALYVQAHDALEIEAIAKGRYVLRFALGTAWDPAMRRFTIDPHYFQFENPLDFQEKRTTKGINYTVIEVTLHQVQGGAASVEKIDEQLFEASNTETL